MKNRVGKMGVLLLAGGLALGLGLGLGMSAGCNWMTSGGPKQLRQGVLVKCNHPKATLYINERIVGSLNRPKGLRVGLTPGTYRMVVRLPGYFTRYVNLKVRADEYQKMTVLLRRELD
jgi:PEGA domain